MAIAEAGAVRVENTSKPADELVLVDAYWIKKYNGREIKIRLLPHQKPVDLYIEYVYKFDDDKHDKDSAPAIDLKFQVDGTFFDGKSTITVSFLKLNKWDPIRKYFGPKSQYNGKILYYFVVKNFMSDLSTLNHRVK